MSSLAPLFVVFGLLGSFGTGWASVICYLLAGASALWLLVALRVWRRLAVSSVTVTRVRHRDTDAIAYVATYVVPFATLGVESWRSKAALGFFLVLIALLYLRAHLFYVNPILSAIGYRLFEAETETGRLMLVLSRRKYIRVNRTIDVRTLSDYVFLEADAAATSTHT
jgi:hypothetical protein